MTVMLGYFNVDFCEVEAKRVRRTCYSPIRRLHQQFLLAYDAYYER